MAINNTVTLIGNMGSEADIIQTDSTTFAAVSIATTDTYQDDTGEWKELETLWHNVITFNPKLIEVLKSLKKGSRLEIIGALSYRPYTVMLDGKDITKKEASVIARKIEQAPLAKKNA